MQVYDQSEVYRRVEYHHVKAIAEAGSTRALHIDTAVNDRAP